MVKRRFFNLLAMFAIFLLGHTLSYAQEVSNFGFGAYGLSQGQGDLSDEKREEIKAQIRQNVKRLKAEGKLSTYEPKAAVLLSFPLKASSSLTDNGFYAISAFVDHDPAYPDHLLDYNCGKRTYDTASGQSHKGTDIFSWPFYWKNMDNNEVIVVAAAAGTIVYRQDGNFDRNCSPNDSDWNGVGIRHSDGSTVWYGHMKKNSVITKAVGDKVSEGEYLGVVGSSGSSTGPHLHFELYDSSDKLNDPFYGSCNKMNSSSWWRSQLPYYDSTVLKLMTSAVPYESPACPTTETPNEKTAFQPGDTIYFTIFYRDQIDTLPSTYTIYKPDNTVWSTWTHSSSQYYTASYWYWYYTLPTDAPVGRWKFQVVFNGKTYVQTFTVGNVGRTAMDFNGDGKSDLLLYNTSTGMTYLWFMNGKSVASGASPATLSDLKWQIVGSGDFDGDGKNDVLWHNTVTGVFYIWLMDGSTIRGGGSPSSFTSTQWQIKGIGDFNGDGKSDVLWYNNSTGLIYIWFMDGASILSAVSLATVSDTSWQIIGSGDFNGDGKGDILWQNTTTGNVAIWLLNGVSVLSTGTPATLTDPSWQFKGVGDFDGDGKSDILWYNSSTLTTYVWLMDDVVVKSGGSPATLPDANWQVKAVGDCNGDGKSDVCFKNKATGVFVIWLMDGTTIASVGSPATLNDPNWQVKPD
ncbi:MAG: VCBS repeat-containing protein [Nitrospirae bacterium]|nr:VCBS repeat-containing protein [Nitrospirota bacterium]